MGSPSVPSASSSDPLHGLDWERAGRCRAVEGASLWDEHVWRPWKDSCPLGGAAVSSLQRGAMLRTPHIPARPRQRLPLCAHPHTRCPPGPRAAAWHAPVPRVAGPPGTRARLCPRPAAPRVVVQVTAGQLQGGDMYPGVTSTKPPSASRSAEEWALIPKDHTPGVGGWPRGGASLGKTGKGRPGPT